MLGFSDDMVTSWLLFHVVFRYFLTKFCFVTLGYMVTRPIRRKCANRHNKCLIQFGTSPLTTYENAKSRKLIYGAAGFAGEKDVAR